MKVLSLLLFALNVTTAAAQTAPPTIDFTKVLVGPLGKPLMEGGDDCKTGMIPGKDCTEVPMTLGDVTLAALETPIDTDRGEDARKKFDRDSLARRVFGKSQVTLSPEDIALIKDRIGKTWGSPQIGAAWPLLDPTLK